MTVWILRDRKTHYFVAGDLLTGYTFTSNRKRAAQFSSLQAARDTVLQVCHGEKAIAKKACIEVVRLSELRSVDRQRYFSTLRS